MFEFRLNFYWNVFVGVQWQNVGVGLDNSLPLLLTYFQSDPWYHISMKLESNLFVLVSNTFTYNIAWHKAMGLLPDT